MAGRLEGKVAIVTGGASGIGEQLVRRLHADGATVAVADITGDQDKLAAELGERVSAIGADMSSDADVQRMVSETVSRHRKLDVLCNNAGIDGDVGVLGDCSVENWDRVIAVNLRGVFLCMRYGIPAMLEGGGGSIINIASVGGLVGTAGVPAYVSSKFGVVGLTRAAAIEYATVGIRVNVVCPGIIRTSMLDRLEATSPQQFGQIIANAESMTPMSRVGTTEEIGAAVAFLASDEASFVTGVAFPVDGGYTAQ